jgi:hypothetical protein
MYTISTPHSWPNVVSRHADPEIFHEPQHPMQWLADMRTAHPVLSARS